MLTYIDVSSAAANESVILTRSLGQAKSMMRVAWYWWDWEKAPIKERIACERLAVIIAASEGFSSDNRSMDVVAKRLGLKQPTLRRWIKLFRFGGLEALIPKQTSTSSH